MARGASSKGSRESRGAGAGGPDWLKPPEASAGAVRAEEPARRNRHSDDDEPNEKPRKGGIQWKPLIFLIMMVVVPFVAAVLPMIDKVAAMGFTLPTMASFKANPYRPCLVSFYADWAPDKLGNVDETLTKYAGRERRMFGVLSKKCEGHSQITARLHTNCRATCTHMYMRMYSIVLN